MQRYISQSDRGSAKAIDNPRQPLALSWRLSPGRPHCCRTSIVLACCLFALSVGAAEKNAYQNPALSVEQRIDDLLPRMTLEEKVGQMCQYVAVKAFHTTLQSDVPDNNDSVAIYPGMRVRDVQQMVQQGRIGSFLHALTASEANMMQQWARESRLQVPLLMGIDAIHGDALLDGTTVYPTPLTLASAFDVDLVEQIARATARETRANGSQWTFSPNVDVARDPRWGRTGETFGEDPYLVGQLGAAMVRGYQGGAGSERIIACMKHLIGGSVPDNGLNGAPTDISEHSLRSVFLPPYVDCIQAGVATVMAAHNEINGIPCHANTWLMEDLLRRQCGFKGFVVSDWLDIERLVTTHFTAADQKEAVFQTVMAGMDMHMHGPNFFEPLVELVKEGRIPESRIDQSVRRILRAKFELGLFDSATVDLEQAKKASFTARASAVWPLRPRGKAIVLLKNKGHLLPPGWQEAQVDSGGRAPMRTIRTIPRRLVCETAGC